MNPASIVNAASPPRAAGGRGFGTAPVFLASISTILGAVMFPRFGYALGNLGLAGAMASAASEPLRCAITHRW